ncbi:MAG TPA: TIGR01777 family protein [Epsilonproteobacteria bacterium]|nr:TIGR01777 family protein [Campylobacterota bacterium]
MKIALTGASGFVGSAIQKKFASNEFIHIHRDDSVERIVEKLEGVDVVINLAGAPIIKRWDKRYKQILRKSRIETTKTLVNAINQSDVKYFISTSAVGIYPNGTPCDESCQNLGKDFLGKMAADWEAEALNCNKPTTILRFGVVLDKHGGALKQMLPPFKLGLGGIIGDGKMITSWIALDDLLGIYEFLFEKRVEGIFNASSPHPVTNYEFTKTLGGVLCRPTIFPLPVFALKILFGEGSSVLTDSKEVYPKALLEAGFEFKYPDIKSALNTILKRR